jgi:ABC-type polysaccharide/polyol phosphate transport system ATPase subunit
LVLASHNKSIISDICSHGLVLEGGRKMFFGRVEDALNFYDEMNPQDKATAA